MSDAERRLDKKNKIELLKLMSEEMTAFYVK
jgi:hypothetical protein